MNNIFSAYDQLLTESRISDLKIQNPSLAATINKYVEMDHTPSKKFVPWLISQHKKGNVTPDHPGVATTIQNFDRYKNTHGIVDHSTKTFQQVHDAVMPLIDTAATSKEKKREILHTGIDKIYDKDGVTAHYVHSMQASKDVYGGGADSGGLHTNWCVSARTGQCRFGDYGLMYTVHIPDDKNSPYAVTNLQNHKPSITSRHNEFTAPMSYYAMMTRESFHLN